MTLNELQKYVEENMNVPDGDDEPFALNFERSGADEEEEWLRYVVSTKRLLRTAIVAQNFHADSTYKICIEGFPLLVMGASDLGGHFHLIGLMLSSNEKAEDYASMFKAVQATVLTIFNESIKPKVLVCDAAIQNAFKEAFGDDPLIAMCWFHVMLNVTKRPLNDSSHKDEIKKDIRTLQLAYNRNIFEMAFGLWTEKWSDTENEFVEYFRDIWFVRNPNWFNGCVARAPKTNNCLERFNGTLKQYQTFYERKGLGEFKVSLMEIVGERSRAYSVDKPPFQAEIVFDWKMSIRAFEYANSDKKIFSYTDKNNTITSFVYAGFKDEQPTLADVVQFGKHEYRRFLN